LLLPLEHGAMDDLDPYRPLEPDHIRLLHHPGATDDPLRCSLHAVKLEQHADKCQALSYEWGQPENVGTTMEIANIPCPKRLQRNLELALREIRSRDNVLILWIDALCISQESLQEKSHQVAIMGKIFKHARNVIAWIGPARDDSDIAMDCIAPDKLRHYEVGTKKPPDLTEAEVKGLNKLVNRPYWSRVWIVQELVLAKDFEVHCGGKTTTREVFYLFVEFTNWSSQFSSAQAKSPAEIHRYGYNVPFANKLAIWMKRCLSVRFTATNPRDYVYALIGVANDVLPGEIVPDYEESGRSLRWAFYQATRGRVAEEMCQGFGSRDAYERMGKKMGVVTDGELAWEKQVSESEIKVGNPWA